jgi:hypothetical protein
MGIFSFFSSPSSKYSQEERQLSELEIKRLVSQASVRTLDSGEAEAVEKAIVVRRHGDGKISLRQIYEALMNLVHAGRISKYDRDGLMRVFGEHFNS